MAHVQYQGRMIYYETSETSGEGQPLLLLPSDTLSSKMYQSVVGLYRNHYQLFLMDFLGTGQSERVSEFPEDFWFDRGQQVAAFLQQQNIKKAVLVGTGGGALAAINAALERPELILAVVADSVPGEYPHVQAEHLQEMSEKQKQESDCKCLWLVNHGPDWIQVIDGIMAAKMTHRQKKMSFFHHDLSELQAPILFTANRHHRLLPHTEKIASELVEKVPRGERFIFQKGEQTPILANGPQYAQIMKDFLRRMCKGTIS